MPAMVCVVVLQIYFLNFCNILQSGLAFLDDVLYNGVGSKSNTYLSILMVKLIEC